MDGVGLLEAHRRVELRGGSNGGFELGVIEVFYGGERGILQRRQQTSKALTFGIQRRDIDGGYILGRLRCLIRRC